VTIQDRMHRADRRTSDWRAVRTQFLPNLRRAPARVPLLEPEDESLNRQGQLIRMPLRPATAIAQAVQAVSFVAVENLVARFPGDAELGARSPSSNRATNRNRSSMT
jgi:hypothetical protein